MASTVVRRLLFTWAVCALVLVCVLSLAVSNVYAEEVELAALIKEALQNSPELKAAHARAAAAGFRVSQAGSLPDPMISFGYQNEGFESYTYGKSRDAQWIFSASQTIPFPGKRGLRERVSAQQAGTQGAGHEAARLRTRAKVKELYFELLSAYRNLDLIRERRTLFDRVEDAALARYSSGRGSQQEVLMAQTEKYMLLEQEEMLRQRIDSIEAALSAAVGRPAGSPVGRPSESEASVLPQSADALIQMAYQRSPELAASEKMIAAAEAGLALAGKDYYPDFTFTGTYIARGGGVDDMWSLTTAMNIPLYYKSKQKQAVYEAEASLGEARSEREAMKLAIASAVKDNHSSYVAADRLMHLYREGLIPKSYQDVDLALAGYAAGSVDALTVITRLKAAIDFEIAYWKRFAERERAVARLEAITGLGQGSPAPDNGDAK